MAVKNLNQKKPSTLSEFVAHVLSWKAQDSLPTAFRGHANSNWKTAPKIFRGDVGIYKFEQEAVRDLVSVHPQEFESDHTMFDRLVRMQHFGLPTRLLDVSLNPLVALWFAAQDLEDNGIPVDGKVQAYFIPKQRQKYYDSDVVSCMANMANLKPDDKNEINKSLHLKTAQFNKLKAVDQLCYHIGMEKSHFRKIIKPADLSRPVYVKPKMSNRRIIAQSGAFLIFGKKVTSFSDSELRLRSVVIPAAAKPGIRKDLEKFGIDASSLFPEIDKASDAIVRRLQNDSNFLDLLPSPIKRSP
jgi:hypothetical protein